MASASAVRRRSCRIVSTVVVRALVQRLRARRLQRHLDAAPPSLAEPRDAQCAARYVTQQDRHPDVGGPQAARRLEQGADPEWHDDLGHDRDVQRRARVARALEPPRVGEGDCDEQPRNTEEAEQLHAQPDDDRGRFIATPWTPVGRPKRNSARMMAQSGRQSIPRCHVTGSRPENSRYPATLLTTMPATAVPTAAPAVPNRGNGPRPVMNATLHAMFRTVRRIPSRSGVRASPTARKAPPTMKKSSVPRLPTNMIRRNGNASARTAGAAFTTPSSAGATTHPSGASSNPQSATAARNA